MTRAKSAPRISFSGWLLGGALVTPRGARPRAAINGGRMSVAAVSSSSTKEVEKDSRQTVEKTEEVSSTVAETGSCSPKPKEAQCEHGERDARLNGKWTAEQDALILSMKADQRHVWEICAAVKASKKEIEKRYQELLTKDNPAVPTCPVGTSTPPPTSTTNSNHSLRRAAAATAATPVSNSPIVQPAVSTPLEEVVNEPKATQSCQAEAEASSSSLAAEAATHILRPDTSWSRDDCDILMLLEARHREQKWLQLQASFYNMTGRMVRADVIRAKFGA